MVETISQRQKEILNLLEEHDEVDLASLVKRLETSEATVRRDLHTLEATGLVIRTVGGARLVKNSSLVIRSFEKKRQQMREEKERIARAAVDLVKPGMIVSLDSGTTIWRLAAALKEKAPLRILTTALATIEELGSIEGMTVYLTGGKFRLENLDFVGPTAVEAFSNLHADIAFIGADSFIPGKGAYSLDETSAVVTAAMGRSAEKRVLVMDHTKFNSQGCWQVLPSTQIDYVVTDAGLDAKIRKQMENETYQLIVVE